MNLQLSMSLKNNVILMHVTEVTCSLIYVTTPSKQREDWCEWWTKMAANLNVFKLTSKRDCILSKSNFSLTEVYWVIYRIRYNKKFDHMSTLTGGRRTCWQFTQHGLSILSIYTHK